MAPILSTAVGVTPQIIDDPRLRKLIEVLNEFEPKQLCDRVKTNKANEVIAPLDIAALVAVIEPHQTWSFEEQVDLHEWIPALNAIDACLAYLIQKYPSVLLIGPVKRKRGRGNLHSEHQFLSCPADSLEDIARVPSGVVETITVLLHFISTLLRNSSSKSVFNSVEELADLLAAADDSVASLALEALRNLATPPSLHKQQSPEVNQHTTGLHTSKTASHRRLIALARGWGTRGSGLGLYTCATTDDSEFGQGSLPKHAGELDFSISKSMQEATNPGEKTGKSLHEGSDYQLVRIHLSAIEIVDDSSQTSAADVEMADSANETVEASKKRRRVGPVCSHAKSTKSTAELFFLCLEKAGGRSNIRDERMFALLADIRLARAYYSNATRVEAVKSRMRALIAILQAHPSQEIMSGYFQAQPELCLELVDLLRPTVSSANVSAALPASNTDMATPNCNQDTLGALASSPCVPYEVRVLAVEALTALVARRDGTSGALTGSARHSSVLNELGVGKGQYLGLLPTLIRYSLASLGASIPSESGDDTVSLKTKAVMAESDSFDVGLVFVEATRAPSPPRLVQVERALEFIDAILTLTSAIVSTPTGTSALTDCGLIPALLTTVATDSQNFINGALPNSSSHSGAQLLRIKSLLRFITAQAIQILEGAIVTHNNALAAFHDLNGVEVLTSRLSQEVGDTQQNKSKCEEETELDSMDVEAIRGDKSEPMEVDMVEKTPQRILSSQRVLLFSIVTCLTVVFHQESTSSSVATPSGGAQLRKPELTKALIDIMDDVSAYGGHLASLIATLLSDVLNSDPHVVHHVHQSGIAKSFLSMLLGKRTLDCDGVGKFEPILPPVPELIMAVPNVISALSLTEDGAKAVKEENPFPSMLRLFHNPNYAMPKSRCLLNEMTAIVGTGLDEVMRHVQLLKPLILSAIADALNEVVILAEDLSYRELQHQHETQGKPSTDLENDRSCLMQYVLNFGQLLEQILHNEDHCEPFVAAGGLEALLKLFPLVMPTGFHFLSHISSLSCSSVSTLHHSTVEESLCLAFKCISLRYDPLKLILTTVQTVKLHLDKLEKTQMELRKVTAGRLENADIVRIDAGFVLEGLPCQALHQLSIQDDKQLLTVLSSYLRTVTNVQWATSLLGTALKTSCQRSQDSGNGWSRIEQEWKKELSTPEFQELIGKLSTFHQSAILEVCRVRSDDDYEKRERKRLDIASVSKEALLYRLRIVCPEGAVVRDGIEIDSCASVGSMEMGEIAEAFDRCVNSSGILRYRTCRGWVSEMTRGHGREPVAEVITFWKNESPGMKKMCPSWNKKRIEAPIPDLRSASASVLARLQTSYSELFSALSKAVVQGVRSLPANNVSFYQGDAGTHAATMMKILSSNVQKALDLALNNASRTQMQDGSQALKPLGVAMYLGSILSHLHACLFEEKRERRMVNVPLLLYLLEANKEDSKGQKKRTLLDAIRFVFEQGLVDFETRGKEHMGSREDRPIQCITRPVAASLPPAISLLRRLMSGSLISSSPAASILSRMKKRDLTLLVGRNLNGSGFKQSDDEETLFSPEDFVKSTCFLVSEVVRGMWIDPRFKFTPPHIVHPFATLIVDIIGGLEDAGKKRITRNPRSGSSSTTAEFDVFGGTSLGGRREENEAAAAAGAAASAEEAFEPSEESIERLEEMGFSRDHAIDALENSRSNRVEIAMEYALSHPPPSPTAIERRRARNEEGQRQREERPDNSAAENQVHAEASGSAGETPAGSANVDTEDPAPSPTGDNQSESAAEPMEVEESEDVIETKEREKNQKGKEDAIDEKEREKNDGEDNGVALSKVLLKEWIKDGPRVACSFMGNLTMMLHGNCMKPNTGEGDGESEALTVVLCSFLLDICQRYPSDCDGIAFEVLKPLEDHIEETSGGAFKVKEGKEASFASLCHATVLFTRALPQTRSLVLKRNLVHKFVSCVQVALGPTEAIAQRTWPIWLASALLILDVMAQPVVAQKEKKQSGTKCNGKEHECKEKVIDMGSRKAADVEKRKGKECINSHGKLKTEHDLVKEEHQQQAALLAETATNIFSAVQTKPVAQIPSDTDEENKTTADSKESNQLDDISKDELKYKLADRSRSLFGAVPAYFPMMPSVSVQPCMQLCVDILRKGQGNGHAMPPPPGIVHATLLLLLRVLRTPKLSTECLQMGAAETILSLPHECNFTGNSGLVTLILRRLLEDELTLQTTMETEIRGTVTKLNGKQKETENDLPSAPHGAFTQGVTPLLCRDPSSFLKAFVLTVKIQEVRGETVVTLLSQAERAHHQKALSDFIKVRKVSPSPTTPTTAKPTRRRSTSTSRHKRGSNNLVGKSKSPPPKQPSSKRTHLSKKHKKEKNEEKHAAASSHQYPWNVTPSNHVVSLLIMNILSSSNITPGKIPGFGPGQVDAFPDDKSFLWTANLLEILADLVLAVPACALAVQKYRLPRGKTSQRKGIPDSINHALGGCTHPPKTFLSYLLHCILPQDRWSIRNDQQIWEQSKEETEESHGTAKMKMAYRLNKVSQTSARLLVALVARPGEGRRRVVSELTFALSGGRLGHSSNPASAKIDTGKSVGSACELHALQAWGELCIGLASPRSNGKNPEGNSSLSFEVIKLMLELGMAHSLLFSIQRVKLHHPMAASTCSSLLMPLEVLTRGSVADAVKALVEKETSLKMSKAGESGKKAHEAATTTEGISVEVTSDEAMLEEAFHQEEPPSAVGDEDNHNIVLEEVAVHDDDVQMEAGIEVHGSADEDISSSSNSEDSSGEDNDSQGGSGDEDDEGSILDSEEDSDGSSEEMEEVEDGDWNVGYREEMEAAGNQEFEAVGEDDDIERNDAGLDEGWTRVENSGFSGMLMGGGSRRHGLPATNGPLTARTRGFIDAAEAMIGTLLRTGEIHGDALAEIEGSLGIRIMSNGRALRSLSGGPAGAESVFAESIAARLGAVGSGGVENGHSNMNRTRSEVVGTLPHVHQRSQPGAGYSALSGGGRWIETSSMEYVYGGPSVTAGSRNYDLISPIENPSDIDSHPNISQLDLQLFPGGPASAAHARTQHSLHPLLCGVDLPPVNALVSDLLPHGIRCTRRGLMTTRRSGDWTNSSFAAGNCLVLTSNGNVIRSNRSHPGNPLSLVSPSHTFAGQVGWTDDGLPFDSTAAQFSSAFEIALRDSMAALQSASEEAAAAESAATTAAGNTQANEQGNNTQRARGTEQAQDTAVAAEELNENPNEPQEDSRPRLNASTDGDGVASSLVEGLRLSPRSETSADRMSTSDPAPRIQQAALLAVRHDDAAMEDVAAATESGEGNVITAMEVQPGELGSRATEEEVAGEDLGTHGQAGAGDAADSGIEEATGADLGDSNSNQAGEPNQTCNPNSNGLVCPPDVDEEVFNQLPVDMQRDCVEQHRATQELAAQLDAGSSLDPEVLAALPEDMRREVMQQEQMERRLREQAAPADPSNAEDMDNASFLASLAPDLREEILLTADETFLNSLPPGIIAEAQILRERAATQRRRLYDETAIPPPRDGGHVLVAQGQNRAQGTVRDTADNGGSATHRRKSRSGKLRVDKDRFQVVYLPPSSGLTAPISKSDLKALLRLFYMLSPVRPARLLQKVFQNLCTNPLQRSVLSTVFVKLLHDDDLGALGALDSMAEAYADEEGGWRQTIDKLFSDFEFPPSHLLGAVPEVFDTEAFNPNLTLLRRKQYSSTAASIAANLPASAAVSRNEQHLPPVVATRVVDALLHLCKNSPRFCLHSLVSSVAAPMQSTTTSFDKLLDLLEKPNVLKSSANLEQLLTLLEGCVSPLSHLSKHADDKAELMQRDIDAAAASGKEWMDVPRVVVSQGRLQLLCSILRMETCRDGSFSKVNTIVRRLCRVDANRGYVLAELASVAHALGADAIRDLKSLRIRLDGAVAKQKWNAMGSEVTVKRHTGRTIADSSGGASSAVTLSTSTSELKLLRVLQTLQALCGETSDEQTSKKNEGGVIVTEELVHLLCAMKLDDLWDELADCLEVVQILEGVSSFKDEESGDGDGSEEESGHEAIPNKKLKNSAAGLLTRFLPSIEAFFVANASSTRQSATCDKSKGEFAESNSGTASKAEHSLPNGNQNLSALVASDAGLDKLVGGKRLVTFVASNKVLLNALVRNNPGLLDKGLRGLVQVPQCRIFLDFDVKRQWFKTQVRRLRQHASRRHGSLRLHIRRKNVFEDAYHQLRLRNADEMRGRLHITFRNEEGVDAGGLSREFFGILAKEMFNPNYALFTSTEDGCTFQPNANSNINPDHLSYFRFVGRIVGKAVADGFLLDAHFTRSLYKHMLGLKPTHHDMEAIDPDYYRNLKTILEYKLEDIGLDLTFSIEDHSFGRNQVIDLIENGRNNVVTEERKAEYVSLVCQHRMTTAINSQIKSYLDGFYELVSPELIAIFNPRELELLISGLPDIDVHDLKKNTDYVGWKATDKEIEWFWSVMFSLSRNEKAAFLQFVTGSSKVPLAGFKELQGMRGVQKFSIHKTGGSSGALMSSHTCFNSLDLPGYKSEDELREKLLYAINEGGGAFMFA